jgi:hypothetical protein
MRTSLVFFSLLLFSVISKAATVMIKKDRLEVSVMTTLDGVGEPASYSGRSYMGSMAPAGFQSRSSNVSWSPGNSYTAEAQVDFYDPLSFSARTAVFVEGEDNAGVAFDGASRITLTQEFHVIGSGALIDLFFEAFDGGTYANILLTDLTTGNTYGDFSVALSDSHRYLLTAESQTLGGYCSDASFSVGFRGAQVIARVPEGGPSLAGTGIALIGMSALVRLLKAREVRGTRAF